MTKAAGRPPAHEGVTDPLRAAGLRSTPQRQLILEVLGASPRHMTAEEVWQLVAQRYSGFNRSTVYRVLDSLVAAGLVNQHVIGAVAQYEPASASVHHHLVCRHCRAVFDLAPADMRSLVRAARERHGFVLGTVGATVEGVCGRCAHPGPAPSGA
ncbi:MAG TPA: Fur family transcriptional regulator [Candidatus Dormibacteraeota bacterium]|nr:Fur family transcriptional regulator [Candidatus Dormibacteraeota bacterium]